jgi:hypothetical protein
MAVILTDPRTIVDELDAVGAWTGGPTLYTSAPDPVELTGSLGYVVSNATVTTTLTITATDLTGELFYSWSLPQGIMDTYVLGGNRIYMSDGTNTIDYHVGGSDLAGFRYNNINIGWQCFVIDPDSPPTTYTVIAGNEALLDWAAITVIGFTWKTLVKSVGGSENCFLDIIRYGSGGLIITGGGSGTEGNFNEIAIADSSNASQKAFGIAHGVASGVVGLQGGLTFNDSAGTGSVDFLSINETAIFEDRGIGTDKYFIKIVGNATGTTSWQIGTKVGTTGGSNGTSLTCPTGVGALFDASDINVEDVLIYGSNLSGFNNGVTFSSDATNGPTHEVLATNFSGCGQVDPGLIVFKNNTIAGTTNADGGYLGNRDIDLLTFTSDGTGHGIYIDVAGTYTYTNNSFGGYGSTGTTDAVIYNNSGGIVTINVNSGDTPTYRNGTGATTNIVSGAVSIFAKAVKKDGTNIQTALVLLRASDNTGPFPYSETVTIVNTGTIANVTHIAHAMDNNDYTQITQGDVAANRGVFQISIIDADNYTYTMSSTPGISPTGTIKSTFVALFGNTDINGEITTSRVYPADQPVIGWARKSSISPFLQEGVLTGTISSTTGYNSTAVMVSDE